MKIGVFGHGRCQITESLGKINLVHRVANRCGPEVGLKTGRQPRRYTELVLV